MVSVCIFFMEYIFRVGYLKKSGVLWCVLPACLSSWLCTLRRILRSVQAKSTIPRKGNPVHGASLMRSMGFLGGGSRSVSKLSKIRSGSGIDSTTRVHYDYTRVVKDRFQANYQKFLVFYKYGEIFLLCLHVVYALFF